MKKPQLEHKLSSKQIYFKQPRGKLHSKVSNASTQRKFPTFNHSNAEKYNWNYKWKLKIINIYWILLEWRLRHDEIDDPIKYVLNKLKLREIS